LKLINDIYIPNEELKLIIDGFSKSTYLLNETISDLGRVVIIRDNPSIEKQNITFEESFKNVIEQITILVDNNNPEIIIKNENNLSIYSNKAYFESILLNLLTNSIKYKSPERELTITISILDRDNFTELLFEDNGIGIDLKKYSDKLFGLYQRFHNYPDSKGLGLYLVKSQIESMGGEITLESEVNKGTKFIIKFKKEN